MAMFRSPWPEQFELSTGGSNFSRPRKVELRPFHNNAKPLWHPPPPPRADPQPPPPPRSIDIGFGQGTHGPKVRARNGTGPQALGREKSLTSVLFYPKKELRARNTRLARLRDRRNHIEERLLDQARAQASYTPPFFGVVCVAYSNVWFLTSKLCKIHHYRTKNDPPMIFWILTPH